MEYECYDTVSMFFEEGVFLHQKLRFEALAAVTANSSIFWDATPCSLFEVF
jgi:hypothetical protein